VSEASSESAQKKKKRKKTKQEEKKMCVSMPSLLFWIVFLNRRMEEGVLGKRRKM